MEITPVVVSLSLHSHMKPDYFDHHLVSSPIIKIITIKSENRSQHVNMPLLPFFSDNPFTPVFILFHHNKIKRTYTLPIKRYTHSTVLSYRHFHYPSTVLGKCIPIWLLHATNNRNKGGTNLLMVVLCS